MSKQKRLPHLQDHNEKKPLTHNTIKTIVHDALTLIHYMHFQHIIKNGHNKISAAFENICMPLFYGLPKIHNLNWPLCPIVYGCDGPIDHVASCITHFTQSFAKNLLSHKIHKTFPQPYENSYSGQLIHS